MKVSRGLVLIGAFLVSWVHCAYADQMRRFVDMSYACGRDPSSRVLFAQETQKHSYEITSWSDPFTESICHKRSDLPQGCIPTELYDFSFRCGSAGNVHITDFYLNSPAGKKFGAHREGDHIVLNGGQERVLISHRTADCHGKGLSLPDMSRCLQSADQYRIDQVTINLPARRAPLSGEVQLTTRMIGDDCGNGMLCPAGNKCSAGGGCVLRDSVDCGNGKSCAVGNKCSFGGGCVPGNSADCGSGRSCPVGTSCGANNACIRPVQQATQVDQHQGPDDTPATPKNRWRDQPAGTASLGFIALFVYGAFKELVEARVAPRNKVAAFLALGAVEWVIFLVLGINIAEPKIIDIISVNIPLAGVTVGLGIYAKTMGA